MTIVVLEALTFGLGRLVEAAERAGERLCLLTTDREVYRYELERLPSGALDIVDTDTHDVSACAAVIERLSGVRGLIGSTDTWAVPGAELAARFGLPGPDPAAIERLRDKHRVRTLLHERGLSTGRSIAVSPAPGAANAVRERVGLPAVLKDTAGTSSRGVWLARDDEQLATALAEAAALELRGGLLAEPFLAGPVYSAETLTWQGRTRLLGVLSRQMSAEPAFREEASAFPVAFAEDERAKLEAWVADVLAAAGHDQGFAHVEFAHTVSGPELIEINARIGGALVGEALCRWLGTNVYQAMIEMALGQRPELLDAAVPSGPAVAFALVYADRVGVLSGVAGTDGLAAFPGSPEWYPTRYPGARIEHLGDQRGCTGIVLVHAATAELALHRVHSAAGSLRPVIAE